MSVSNESAHPSADKQGTLGNPMKFKGQDFELLRNLCLISGYRFRDGIFPSNMDSIGPDLLTAEELSRVEWVRPGSQHKNPHLFVHGVSRFDIHQGKVGNCWFLAALGSLTFVPRIMNNVIPSGQGFTQKYVGIFHFRFWRFGKWMDIVIDDKLPTLDGRYLFVGPANGNEFWPALLEKAYAKVCGSYSDLHSGLISEALVDFTGGVHISFNLTKPREDLWEIMQRAAAHESLMGSGSHSEPGVKPVNTVLKNGLVQAHAYAVTGVNMVHCGNKNVKLVRLWNPWGNTEWNGSWSDKMAMEDFTANFTQIDICNVYPHFLDSGNDCIWAMSEHNGSWIKGTSAGGSLKEDTFWKNPQYRVNLKTAHLDCSSSTSFNFVVYLMQKLANKHRKQSLRLHIGFSIFKVGRMFFIISRAGSFVQRYRHYASVREDPGSCPPSACVWISSPCVDAPACGNRERYNNNNDFCNLKYRPVFYETWTNNSLSHEHRAQEMPSRAILKRTIKHTSQNRVYITLPVALSTALLRRYNTTF
ncbi:UNVERIFIED_CONTAM: hypothetical protein FKN15_019094 [Acipenser sinensis]